MALGLPRIGAGGRRRAALTLSTSIVSAGNTVNVAQLYAAMMGTTIYSKLSGSANVSVASDGQISLASGLEDGAVNEFVARAQNEFGDAFERAFSLTGLGFVSNRIPEITTAYNGITAVVPQGFYDFVVADANDPETHPPIGASTHTAIRDGNWSEPDMWSAGTVPGENAIVRTGPYTVTYDVESNVKIKDLCVCTGGKLFFTRMADWRLWVDTIQAHGVLDMGSATSYIPESATLGKPRGEIVLWASEAPGRTTRLGINTMAPVRIHGAPKTEIAFYDGDILAGTTTLEIPNLAALKWREQDDLIFVGTERSASSPTDPHYQGPTAAYAPHQGSYQNLTNNAGYWNSQDEVRKILSIDGNFITFAALTYNHYKYHEELNDQVADLKVPIGNLSRSIRIRTAGDMPGDLDIWPDADLTDLQKRGHTMFMFNDDIQVRYAEAHSMGRTDTDPSLADPGGAIRYSNSTQTTPITNVNNVRGRYAWHIHRTGPYFARKQVIFKGLTAWAPTDGPPMPGWAITHHASRAAIEDCIVYNVRGAGIVSELGNEIGHWLRNLVCWCRGDGFPVNWGGRQEEWTNHNGHAGTAYENQSRQVISQHNIASSSRFTWMFFQQNTDIVARVADDKSLRVFDPITQGGMSGLTAADNETYGVEQPQIIDWTDNISYSSGLCFYVAHRQFTDRGDQTPMIALRNHCINVSQPFHLQNYSFYYWFYDALWMQRDKSGVACYVAGNTWQMMFGNIKFKNYNTAFYDDGLGFNYDGFMFDNIFDNVTTQFDQSKTYTHNINDDVTQNPYYGVMGPWTMLDPNTPNPGYTVRVRTWQNLNSATDFPQPYPAAPLGLGGVEPLPGTPKPYFYLNPESDTTLTATGTNTISLSGVIVDHAGVRKWPDGYTTAIHNAAAALQAGYGPARVNYNAQGTDIVKRNGCFNDDGTWKTRLWFTNGDRLKKHYFQFYVDLTLTGFAPEFLAAYERPIPEPWVLPVKLEAIPDRPIDWKTTPPAIVHPTTKTINSGEVLSFKLQCEDVTPYWTIDGGADAAKFKIVKPNNLTWADGFTAIHAAPEDAGGNNVYDVTVRCADIYGNFNTGPVAINIAPTVVSDNFNEVATTSLLSHTGEYGATWTAHPTNPNGNEPMVSPTGRVYYPYASAGLFLASGVPSSANQWAEVALDYETYQLNHSTSILLRYDPVAATGYVVQLTLTSAIDHKIQLFRVNAGTWTNLGEKIVAVPPGTKLLFRGEVSGTTIKAFFDGVEEMSRTNNNVTVPGRVGMRLSRSVAQTESTGMHVGSFFAGVL